jgi:DHA1 family tetracycline resistance protein-like MFS transporter
MGVATMIGPGLFAATFAWFIGDGARLHLPGAAYLLAASLLAAGALLAAHVTRTDENSGIGPLGRT